MKPSRQMILTASVLLLLYELVGEEQGVPLALAISQKVLNGRGAWRLQGGGFAGTIQAFVPLALLETYKNAIDAVFGAGSCHVLSVRNYGAVMVTPDM